MLSSNKHSIFSIARYFTQEESKEEQIAQQMQRRISALQQGQIKFRDPDIEKVFRIVKDKISLGHGNHNHFVTANYAINTTSQVDQDENQKIIEIHRNQIFNIYFLWSKTLATVPSKNEEIIVELLLSTILAEVYKRGNCYETTAIAFLEFLKLGNKNSIEFISIYDIDRNITRKVAYTYDHVNLFLNSQRNINRPIDPNNLTNFILFDAWGLATPIEYHGTNHASFEVFTFGKGRGENIKSGLRIEQSEYRNTWEFILSVLIAIKNIFNSDDNHLNLIFDKIILENILFIIEREIECYKKILRMNDDKLKLKQDFMSKYKIDAQISYPLDLTPTWNQVKELPSILRTEFCAFTEGLFSSRKNIKSMDHDINTSLFKQSPTNN